MSAKEESLEELEKEFGAKAVEELTPEELLEHLKKQEYGVRVLQNEDFFHTKGLWDTKENMIKDIKASIKVGSELSSDIGNEIVQLGAKLLAIICAYEFQKTQDEAKWEQVIENGKVCGWDVLKSEGWRGACVAQASGASYAQSIKALEKTDDLEEAVKLAPRMLLKLPPLQGTLPDPSTKRRIKIKKT